MVQKLPTWNKPIQTSVCICSFIHLCYYPCGPLQLSWYGEQLRARRSGDRILVRAIFSVPVPAGPGAHAASCTMGTGTFPGTKRLGRFVEHTPPSSVEVKERVDVNFHSSSVPPWQVIGQLYLYLHLFPSPIFYSAIPSTERPPLKSAPPSRSINLWRYAHPSDIQNTLNAQALPLKYHVNGLTPGRGKTSFSPKLPHRLWGPTHSPT
jgi:hypothetical protein